MKLVIKAQLELLELLKGYGLLEKALKNELPAKVFDAAKTIIANKYKSIPWDKEKKQFIVSADEQEEIDKEIDEYLLHYRMVVRAHDLGITIMKPERFIEPGKKYIVKSGAYEGKIVKVKGEDKNIYGTEWLNNPGNPACEIFPFRAEHDKLDITKGRLFVCQDGKRDILLSENEIGKTAKD